MKLKLVNETDPILKQKTNPIECPSDFEDIAKDMYELMLESNGIGLAAPQVGLSDRLFVMGDSSSMLVCINPSIVEASEEISIMEEGCLSFPHLTFKVKRPENIIGQWTDLSGNLHTERFEGILARCFQHELDHLDGFCFTDKASRLIVNMARKKRAKRK